MTRSIINAHSTFHRAIVAVALSIPLLGCATQVPLEEASRIRSVGVASFCGEKFSLNLPGIGGIGIASDAADWRVDSMIIRASANTLAQHYQIRDVVFDSAGMHKDFVAPSFFTKVTVSEVAQKYVTTRGVDAYVIISPRVWYDTYDPANNPHGIGLRQDSPGKVALLTLCQITVLDGRDFRQIASREMAFADNPFHWGTMVDGGLWADAFDRLTSSQKTELIATLEAMLQEEIPATLRNLQIVP